MLIFDWRESELQRVLQLHVSVVGGGAEHIDVTGYLVTPGHAVILLSAAPLSPRACQGSRQKTVLDVGCSFHGAFQGQPPTISKTVPVRKRHRNTVTVGVSV